MDTVLVSDVFIDYACRYLNYDLPCSCQPLVFHGQVIIPIMSLVLFIFCCLLSDSSHVCSFLCSMLTESVFNTGAMKKETSTVKSAIRYMY